MARFSNSLIKALLALTLALASVQMAVARGAPAPVGILVICSGLGTATVLVDADGQPTRATHLCPDCALSVFAAVADAAAQTRALTWHRFVPSHTTTLAVSLVPPVPCARGPPLGIAFNLV